jgi:hypothetical protein
LAPPSSRKKKKKRVTFKSSEYSEDRAGVEVVDVEDYLDCVSKVRQLSGDSEEIVDVGKYLAWVDDVRDLFIDGSDDAQYEAQKERTGLSLGGQNLSMGILGFCGKHGTE